MGSIIAKRIWLWPAMAAATSVPAALAALVINTGVLCAQGCVGVAGVNRNAAFGRLMALEVDRIGLRSPDSLSQMRFAPQLLADSAASLYVLVGWTRTGVSGGQFVAIAARDSVCALATRGIDFGIRADTDAFRQWNEGLPRVGAHVQVETGMQARRLAAAVLTYATSVTWDTLWTSVHEVGEGWNVGGAIALGGGRRLFFVHLDHHGQVESLFLQWPADPSETTRPAR